jgi:glycine/D-amino acid oxidase-like deaminating enzyme
VQTLPVYEPAYAEHHDAYFRPGILEAPVACGTLPLAGPPREGRVFTTDFIHTPRFLRELRDDIAARGARFATATIDAVAQVRDLEDRVVVNCLGLGAREVFGDEAMFPAYGLLVHFKPQPLGYIVHDGYKYMFPREDALILGGVFRPDVWSLTPDMALAQEIVSHHRAFFGLDRS